VIFANRDRAVVATLTFTRDRRGKIIVAIGTRDRRIAAVAAIKHHGQGSDKTSLACNGVTSHWNRPGATLQLRLPAGCINAGNYGASGAWLSGN